MAFTHLHVHTAYSLLDGACRISDLVARAKELGMTSLAITDHGVMFGCVEFYKACKEQGIKPIIGCEVYVAPRSRMDKEAGLDKGYGHLILLCENDTGYRNLVKLVSQGFTEGFYYKPRVDEELLRQHHQGLIALSGCLAGFTQQRLLKNDYQGAKEEALKMETIFGKGNFFLELQDQGLPEERAILPGMLRLHRELDIPLVATNDVHYVRREDSEPHDVLLCIQTNAKLADQDRMRFSNDQFYLKSEEEMRQTFADLPEACDNTQMVADRCQMDFDFDSRHIPDFPVPEGTTTQAYLEQLCQAGMVKKYGVVTPEMQERMEYEIGVIAGMGFVEYFLIVWDYVRFAKEKGIPVGPGRGSAAGSMVAYCLDITDTDPLKNGLIFERFLNPERVSMPDIDIDFSDDRRDEVKEYVVQKYGRQRVSQIITFGTFGAKQSIRDVCRVMDISFEETGRLAKTIPGGPGVTLQKAFETSPDFRQMYEENPLYQKVIDTAQLLEGMPRHASVHAAGIVVSAAPIDDYIPLYTADKGICTQYEAPTLEEMGFLKMDFLGLRNLSVIHDAVAFIEENKGEKVDIKALTYDDPQVYKMISGGNTPGIFQLESAGMTSFMRELKPDCFEDIVAGIALYRPGPMDSIPTYIANKKNPAGIQYLHPSLKPILDVTYGCIVYQEQVMQIVRDLGGYTYGHSDELRRAMSKKKKKVMEAEEVVFLEGAEKNGVPRPIGKQIYDQMITFASYAFNKSHAAAYAMVGYQTAWLKCHYPTEFMAALLTSVMGDAKQTAIYIRNAQEMNIQVLPPDVNSSKKYFTAVEEGTIRFGLLGIKHLGEHAIDAILTAREKQGAFRDFFDFVNSIDTSQVNKKALESLIRAGAFDTLEENRAALLAIHEEVLGNAQNTAKSILSGQLSLFQLHESVMEETQIHRLPDVRNFDSSTLGRMEKEMLGVYITAHPLDEFRQVLPEITDVDSLAFGFESEEEESLDNPREGGSTLAQGDRVAVAGIVTSVRDLMTKKNQPMARLELEDFYGTIGVIAFPKAFQRSGYLLEEDQLVYITGVVSEDDRQGKQLFADTVEPLAEAAAKGPLAKEAKWKGRNGKAPARREHPDAANPQAGSTPSGNGGEGSSRGARDLGEPTPVKVRIPQDMDLEDTLEKISAISAQYPGQKPFLIYLPQGGMLRGKERVSPASALKAELAALVGVENVR